MPGLEIEEFIYQVKRELLGAQKKHEGEDVFFRLRNVELEITIATTISGDGKVNLQVVQLDSEIVKEHTHSIKLAFEIPKYSKKGKKINKKVKVSQPGMYKVVSPHTKHEKKQILRSKPIPPGIR